MPNGFFGNASENYLDQVATALEQADSVLQKDPFANDRGKAPTPPQQSTGWYGSGASYPTHVDVPNMPSYPSPDRRSENGNFGNYKTGIGNETNIVVGKVEYQEILSKIQLVDNSIAEQLYNLTCEIESLCETIYIVPSTLPKYLGIVEKIKNSLSEFQNLTESVESQTRNYVKEISDVDRG